MTQQTLQDQSTAPWRDRRFLVFATGNFVNNLGEGAYKVGLPLFVYELTGSLAVMSLLAALVPAMLLISPWLGAVVDRWGPRVFVVPGLLIQLTGALALNLTVLAGRPSTVALFCLTALVQLGGEMYRAGWIAGVPGMFPHNAARSRAVLGSLFVTSNIAGPLLVAVGVGLVGYLGLLWSTRPPSWPPSSSGSSASTRPRRRPAPRRTRNPGTRRQRAPAAPGTSWTAGGSYAPKSACCTCS
ncbi:MFS transporter [Streptomyces sp. ISL-94]|uniref:MFS transporter n=1 Tax=Streptomyces sp. ISL-94 TaxID=2819190 RepID=UPI001BE64AE4|nr:MFS transporter [Streptomyces sp. ISL-94]